MVPQNESASGIPRVKLVLLGDSVSIPLLVSTSTAVVCHSTISSRFSCGFGGRMQPMCPRRLHQWRHADPTWRTPTDWQRNTGSHLQGVGKSCLVLRYVRGAFDPSSKVTIGAAFMSHSTRVASGDTVKFEIWCAA